MNSKEQVKNIIENFTTEEKLEAISNADTQNLTRYDITKIAESIEDESIKIDIIRNYEKYDLDGLCIFGIVKTIDNDDFKKELIDNHTKYNLESPTVKAIARSIHNEDYRKEIIRKWKEYEFYEHDILSIGRDLDTEFLDGISEEMEAYYTSDPNAISIDEEKLEAINNADTQNLTRYDITKIAESIEDESIKIDIIRNYEKYDLDGLCIFGIVKTIDNDDFKKELIDNHTKYNLESPTVKAIARSIHNEDYRKEIIRKWKEYKWHEGDILSIGRDLDTEFLDNISEKIEAYYTSDPNAISVDEENKKEVIADKTDEELKSLIEETEADIILLEKSLDKTDNSNEALDLRNDIMYDIDLIRACKRHLEAKTSEHEK